MTTSRKRALVALGLINAVLALAAYVQPLSAQTTYKGQCSLCVGDDGSAYYCCQVSDNCTSMCCSNVHPSCQ